MRRALAQPHEPDQTTSVATHAAALEGRLARLTPGGRQVLVGLLHFLAWRATVTNTPAALADALARLEVVDASLEELPPLRLVLMDRLHDTGAIHDYLAQGEKLLAHRCIAAYAGDVLQVLDRAYTAAGPAALQKLIAAAPPAVRSAEQVQAALEVCAAAALEDPSPSRQPISVELVGFSKRLSADAHLANASIAESRGDNERLIASVNAAIAIVPQCSRAGYWRLRAALRVTQHGTDTRQHVQDPSHADAATRRLLLLADLHRGAGMQSLEAVVPMLRNELGTPGMAESRLVARVVQVALAHMPEALSVKNAGAVAGVCELVEATLGELPWTQFYIALSEVLIDREYTAACARLEKGPLRGQPNALTLLRIACILRGAPASDPGTDPGKPLTWVAAAMNLLLSGKPSAASHSPATVLQQLELTRASLLTRQFPDLRDVVWALSAGLAAVDGGKPWLQAEIAGHKLSPHAPAWVVWVYRRLRLLTQPLAPADKLPMDGEPTAMPPGAVETGSVVDVLQKQDNDLRTCLAAARRAIRNRDSAAVQMLEGLLGQIQSASLLSAAWWRPLLAYWLGVALAHARDGRAAPTLESLLGGPRTNEASGQLALLDLRRGDLASASKRLENVSPTTPSSFYARAVLMAHGGNATGARELLTSQAADCLNESPYLLPARRLVAALLERTGQQQQAQVAYEQITAAHPGDELTVLRRATMAARAEYATFQSGGVPANAKQWSALLRPLAIPAGLPTERAESIRCVLDLMVTSSPDSASAIVETIERAHKDPMTRRWWRQVAAMRLLQVGQPAAARSVLGDAGSGSPPPAVARSRAVLDLWAHLSGHRQWNRSAVAVVLRGCAKAIGVSAPASSVIGQWREIAEIATSLLDGQEIAPERWRSLGAFAMGAIGLMFDDDADVRQQAAREVLAVLRDHCSRWAEAPQLLLHAAAAWNCRDDAEFLKHYAILEPALDELPVEGRDLWLAAALLRYSKCDWQSLQGKNLPDCVADMSDPLVSLIVELADARSAVAGLSRPSLSLAQKLKGIQNNLGALVGGLSPATSDGNETVATVH